MGQIITDLEQLRIPASPIGILDETGAVTEDCKKVAEAINAAFEADENLVAISAPQLGIDARAFGLKFSDGVKLFLNPILNKKAKPAAAPEIFSSMPGKEIFITRPNEVSIVYYNNEYKYESNKLLGTAARIFDQQYQVLEGILPDVLGLVSDVESDGSIMEASDEELAEIAEFYKTYIEAKCSASKAQTEQLIEERPELKNAYNMLNFSERVINGYAAVVAKDGKEEFAKAKKEAFHSAKFLADQQRASNNAQRKQFVSKRKK